MKNYYAMNFCMPHYRFSTEKHEDKNIEKNMNIYNTE